MSFQTVLILMTCTFLALWGMVRRHRRLREEEEMDREFRANLLRKGKEHVRSEVEEDAWLALKAGHGRRNPSEKL